MSFDRRMKNLGAMLLGLVLLAPVGFAQERMGRDREDDDRQGNVRGRDDDGRQCNIRDRQDNDSASNFGYEDGSRHGDADRARRARYDYRSDLWRRGDRGYQRYMGPRGLFIQAYRNAYIRGYEAAFYGRNGNGRWGRGGYGNGGYGGYGNGGYDSRYLTQIAQRNGYEDGVYYGQMDWRNGHSNRPTQVNGYRDADRGYSSSLGSRDLFKRVYRDAFIRGYQQGYGNGGGRRR
jgi:hypothetical protein